MRQSQAGALECALPQYIIDTGREGEGDGAKKN